MYTLEMKKKVNLSRLQMRWHLIPLHRYVNITTILLFSKCFYMLTFSSLFLGFADQIH